MNWRLKNKRLDVDDTWADSFFFQVCCCYSQLIQVHIMI